MAPRRHHPEGNLGVVGVGGQPQWPGQGPCAPCEGFPRPASMPGAQCAKHPQTWVWLLGAITRKRCIGEPRDPKGGRPSPLPPLGWAIP